MSLFERLRTEGFSLIEQMVAEREEETLHLEFKELASPNAADLKKENKTLIARAICGMANAEGGVLILGVKARGSGGVDVAQEITPLAHAEALRRRITAAIAEMLSFQHPGIEAVALCRSGSAAGVVAIHVPPSDRRPHMSIPHWGYFRRGSQGNTPMTHGEVRDLILAERSGSLAVGFEVTGPSSRSSGKHTVQIAIVLSNDGSAPVWAPYLISTGAVIGETEASVPFRKQSSHRGRRYGFYGSRDIMIPPGDSIILGLVRATALIHSHVPEDVENALAYIKEQPQLCKFNDKADLLDAATSEEFPAFHVTYGAANVAQSKRSMDLTREDVLREILVRRQRGSKSWRGYISTS